MRNLHFLVDFKFNQVLLPITLYAIIKEVVNVDLGELTISKNMIYGIIFIRSYGIMTYK